MRTGLLVVLLCTVLGTHFLSGGPRERVVEAANGYVGVHEVGGNNRGPQVEKFLKSSGANPGDPWCAAFNVQCYLDGWPEGKGIWPRSAWSPDWSRNPTWTYAKKGTTPKPGDSWGIYFPSMRRVAHTGLIKEWGTHFVLTFEGNTNQAGTRDSFFGDRVMVRKRPISSIYAVRNWVDR